MTYIFPAILNISLIIYLYIGVRGCRRDPFVTSISIMLGIGFTFWIWTVWGLWHMFARVFSG